MLEMELSRVGAELMEKATKINEHECTATNIESIYSIELIAWNERIKCIATPPAIRFVRS